MENDIFNVSEALSRMDGDIELLKEIAGLFLESYPSQLAGIQHAIARNDSKALESAAHDIKGSVGVFCAKPAFDAALRLEIMGRESNLTRGKETYIMLEKEIERLRPKLEAIISEKTP